MCAQWQAATITAAAAARCFLQMNFILFEIWLKATATTVAATVVICCMCNMPTMFVLESFSLNKIFIVQQSKMFFLGNEVQVKQAPCALASGSEFWACT